MSYIPTHGMGYSDSSSNEFNVCMPEMQSHDYYRVFVCHKCNHMVTTLCLYAINAVTLLIYQAYGRNAVSCL
jgi:hypothetical protein